MEHTDDFLEYVTMVNNLNNIFDNIKYEAFKKYEGFNRTMNKTKQYETKLDIGTFKTGENMYKILPVGTSSELGAEPSFIAFDGSHPTGFEYQGLIDILDQYNLPSIFTSVVTNDATSECFKFGYMLSAIICAKIKGKTFVNVCPKVGTRVWFVIIKSINKSAKESLSLMIKNKNEINNQEADEWYNERGFNIPLIVEELNM